MEIRLYMLCYRGEALVASHLEPEAFGHYMATGTKKLTRGSLMFFELDRKRLTGDYFRLHDLESRCVPHPDGSPKRSKYVSIYRVLEHVPVDAILRLHLVTLDGRVLSLDPRKPEDRAAANEYLYQELSPVTPLIASTLDPTRFCAFMTNPEVPLYLPRLFFADLSLDRETGGRLAGYLPYEDPAHIESCLEEMRAKPEKPTKTISRSPSINAFFRTVNRGFYVGDKTALAFFPFPERRALETDHARWWRSAQMG
ncbi:MAG: hypothetical protein HY901_26390 [Deltaproteobacteria bacterium]|nr:hypothetical protein [Deltaproteobacteria bacterium]